MPRLEMDHVDQRRFVKILISYSNRIVFALKNDAQWPIKSKLNRRSWSPIRMDLVCTFSLAPSAPPPSRPIRFQIDPAMRAMHYPHCRSLEPGSVPNIVIPDYLVREFPAVHAHHLFCKSRFAFTYSPPMKQKHCILGECILEAHCAVSFAGFLVAVRWCVAELTFKSATLKTY